MNFEQLAIVVLSVITAFLLYIIYKIKYELRSPPRFVPKSFEEDIRRLEKEGESRVWKEFDEIRERLRSLEERMDKYEETLERLATELA